MGQKVNAISFRLDFNRFWDSKWFAKNNYSALLHDDLELRSFFKNLCRANGLYMGNCFIKRTTAHVFISVFFCGTLRRLLLPNLDKLNVYLTAWNKVDTKVHLIQMEHRIPEGCLTSRQMIKYVRRFRHFRRFHRILHICNVAILCRNSSVIAQCFARNLLFLKIKKQKTLITFIQILLKGFRSVTFPRILGIRILIKGRINGSTRTKQNWLRVGKIPLQTISKKVDYAFEETFVKHGSLGIKVWLFYE